MLRKNTPCDLDGICPYDSQDNCTCEYWCGFEPEPETFEDEYEES